MVEFIITIKLDLGVFMATIKDIAERAGVSTTTVSNVIHKNTKKVSPENMEKINRLIKELGYELPQRNNLPHNDDCKLIAVVVNSHKLFEYSILADPFYGEMVGFIESYLREAGYYMMLYTASDVDDIFNMVTTWNVDGVITITFSEANCEKLYSLINKPVISIDAHEQKNKNSLVPNIGIDNHSGGYLMGRYLLEHGYENILICGNRDYGNDHLRWEGVRDAFRDFNSDIRRKMQFNIIGDSLEQRNKYYAELRRHIPFKTKTAAFFLSDFFAMEALSFLTSSGVRIPHDIGICGFDGLMYGSRWASPSLTTINQDIPKRAKTAVEVLIRSLTDESYIPENITLGVVLLPRDSV